MSARTSRDIGGRPEYEIEWSDLGLYFLLSVCGELLAEGQFDYRLLIAKREIEKVEGIRIEPNLENAVRPAKAGAFSGSQSRQGKSQEPCSLSRRQEGNQMI
jgi:hypothetical protein